MKIYLISANPRLTTSQEQELNTIGDLTIINAQKLKPTQVIAKASDAQILIAGPSGVEGINKELIFGLKQLEYIALLTVGHAWVDLKTCKKRGVSVSTIKGATAESVAEHAWGMILSLAKRITEFDRDIRTKGAYQFNQYRGKEVYGKTIGIIGTGDIDKKVARIANVFNMKVIGNNLSGNKVEGIKWVDLETLYKQSDVISINLPLNPETRGAISHQQFKYMKDGVILVNTAREQIVNQTAVLKALKSGKLFGYGVETDIMQPVPKAYLTHPRIIVTPHNAFNTEDAERKTFNKVISNIESYLAGKPENTVN